MRTRSRNHHRQTSGSPARSRFWIAFVIATLLLSLVPALVNPATAQPDTEQADEAAEQPVEQPVTDPTAADVTLEQPVMEPAATETTAADVIMEPAGTEMTDNQSPQEQPQDDPPVLMEAASVVVNYRLCPDGTDLSAPDPAALAGACTVAGEGVTFGLTPTVGNIGSQSTGAAPGTVTFPEVFPDTSTLMQQGPPPAGGLAVFCEGNTSQGNTKPYARFLVAGTVVTLDLLPGEQVSCDWYAGPEQQPVDGTVTVHSWVCPPGTDLTAPDPSTFGSLCTGQEAGVSFELSSAGLLGFPPRTASVGPSGAVQFTDVLPGLVQLTRTAEPVQSMAVFCEGSSPQGNTKPYARYSLTDVQQWFGINLDVLAAEQIWCDWYVADAATQGDITVIIRKHACPAGYNVSNPPDEADMAANCNEPAGVANFTVSQITTGYQPTSGTVPNQVVFTGGPNVPLWIYEQFPENPVAFCSVEDGLGAVVVPTRPYSLNATGWIVLDAPGEGNVVQCDWYGTPTIENSTVTVYTWGCSEGYDHMALGADPRQDCTDSVGGPTFVLSDTDPATADIETYVGESVSGAVVFGDLAPGDYTLNEIVPPLFSSVFVQECEGFNPAAMPPIPLSEGLTFDFTLQGGQEITCHWFHTPGSAAGTVTIHKWECPQGMVIELTLAAHQSACTQPMDNVTFTLTDSKGPRAKMTSGGVVEWTDVQIEPITVTEEIPFGYSAQPYVSCDFDVKNASTLTDAVINGTLTATLNHPGQKIVCNWFNQYLGPGDLTIHKWTCPEGYDFTAWGADPKTDCAEATNGVTFVLDQPAGGDLQSNTGDAINGAVTFGGLSPGDYVVNEIVPDGISEAFVLDCVGLYTESVHPVPLSVGSTLQIRIAGGDRIECNWYNVPAMDPDYGWMTVTKYTCSTATYVSDIDCEVFEGGKTFDLQMWNGATWVASTAGTTNTAGQLTWTNLVPGAYQMVEQGGAACHTSSDPADANGNPTVSAGAGTIVKVYNCGVPAPSAGKTPTKFPNTGVEPAESSRPSGQTTPAAALLGALGLLGTASVSRRTFLRRSLVAGAVVGSGSLAVASGLASQPIQPIGETGSTPSADCRYPATPEVTPAGTLSATPGACARGAVPVHITIPVIAVDAGIEVLEIIGGAMQQPTTAEDVAWYKESARLGERGNVLLAGHLNFWGVPEGVFFLLGQLKEGDAIELDGDDGETYRYIVQWSEDFPSDEEPPEEALGQTEEEAITLITCGGEWNVSRAEYDHRTLVRAIREPQASASIPAATPGS